MIPGFDDASLINFAENPNESTKAIVLALYGTGNAPTRKASFMNFVKKAISNGVVVVITTQCLRGSVQLGSYATGIQLKQLGLIDAHDMTIEAIVTKLSYLLGRGLKGEELTEAMHRNLRGELTHPSKMLRYNQQVSKLLSNL